MTEQSKALCFRCENRALYLETKHAMRVECAMIHRSSCSCYCYKPTKPITFKARDGDSRPLVAGILSARIERMEDTEMGMEAHCNKENHLTLFWQPMTKCNSIKK